MDIGWTLFFSAINWRKFCANGDWECGFFGRSSTSGRFGGLDVAQTPTNANKWHKYQQLSHTHQLKNDRVENITHLPMLVICINMYPVLCQPPQHHTLILSKDCPNKKRSRFLLRSSPIVFYSSSPSFLHD